MSEQTCSIGFVRCLLVAAPLTPRSAQLTSTNLCLDFLYRNPLLGARLWPASSQEGCCIFAMQLGNIAAK
jgi:hypothetical protein